jgi:hypothetical protein
MIAQCTLTSGFFLQTLFRFRYCLGARIFEYWKNTMIMQNNFVLKIYGVLICNAPCGFYREMPLLNSL